MSLEDWLLFVAICSVASFTPGPGILAVIAHSAHQGVEKTIPMMIGIIVGLATLSLMAILGLDMVLETSKTVFIWLQYGGAAYLFYLGFKAFFSQEHLVSSDAAVPIAHSKRRVFAQGFFISLVNPKAIGFFSALFLPFVNSSSDTAIQFGILLITLIGCSIASLLFYSFAAKTAAPSIAKYSKTFNRLTGGCFMGMSALAVISHK